MISPTVLLTLSFLLLFFAPIAVMAAAYWRKPRFDWRNADRGSAGLLLPARSSPLAAVRVFAARTVSWRGIFAVHSWIVLKGEGAPAYERYDLTAWGDPIRRDGFDPDGRWFGALPQIVFAADGPQAGAMIGPMRAAIDAYRYRHRGDYRAWPGPNSNTFVTAILAAVPEARATLPPHAIGKDYPVDGRVFGWAPSRTGFRLSLGGYAGITLAWVEGLEVNLFGGVIGIDWRRPALKLPAIGRLGLHPS